MVGAPRSLFREIDFFPVNLGYTRVILEYLRELFEQEHLSFDPVRSDQLKELRNVVFALCNGRRSQIFVSRDRIVSCKSGVHKDHLRIFARAF